jgi:hypothetical protein
MNQEVIRDFLNVPGIVGIALLSGHSEPVFYTHHPVFAKGQKELLFQNVLQIVDTISPEYEVLSFQFEQNQIAIHRLQSNFIALVIKDDSLNPDQFISAFEQLKSSIAENPKAAIEEFQTLPAAPLPKLADLLDGMNQLAEFTSRFLGIAVITNYWKSSRPETEWMQQFQISRAGQVSFIGELSALEKSVTAEELDSIRDWVQRFITRCSQAVRNYKDLVEQQALTDLQKALLLP